MRPFVALLLAATAAVLLAGSGPEAGAQTGGTGEYTVTDLGHLGGFSSAAYSVNGSGHVVGEARDPDSGWDHAFLYRDDRMTDLGTLGGSRSEARGVNSSGQVVG